MTLCIDYINMFKKCLLLYCKIFSDVFIFNSKASVLKYEIKL